MPEKEKTYVARGTGYTIVDAIGENITVNGDSILRTLSEHLDGIDLNEFYGKVEVRITMFDKPVGMQISEE